MLNSTSVDEMLRFHERQDGAVDECAPGSAGLGLGLDRGRPRATEREQTFKIL